jgi:hypothetical protein
MGSTLAARRAGSQQAASETAVSSAITAIQVVVSVGVVAQCQIEALGLDGRDRLRRQCRQR